MGSASWINRQILENAMREAKKRGAAVFRIDSFTSGDAFRALVFTSLSARTKDETTLEACKRLFSRYSDVKALAKADVRTVEKLLYGVGFYRVKARSIIALSKKLLSDFDGEVPADFDALISLPGVGRKTANVVLAHTFGKAAIGVDVHVQRISNRLGILRTRKPEETEATLVRIIPEHLHSIFNIALVSHGQTTCLPRVPVCSRCVMAAHCRRVGVTISA